MVTSYFVTRNLDLNLVRTISNRMEQYERVQFFVAVAVTCACNDISRVKLYDKLGWESPMLDLWHGCLIRFYTIVNYFTRAIQRSNFTKATVFLFPSLPSYHWPDQLAYMPVVRLNGISLIMKKESHLQSACSK